MTITKKVTLVVTLLAAVLLIATGYSARVLEERHALDQARERSQLLARVLGMAAESELRDHGQLGAFVDLVRADEGHTVVFFDADGRAVAPVPTEEDPGVYGRIREVLDKQRSVEEIFRHDGQAIYVYRVPLYDPRRRLAGAMELRVNLEATAHRGRWAVTIAVVAAMLLALFSALVALYARRRLGRPIRQLMKGMDHVIQGDLAHVLPLDSREEIGRIAYRFNEMTARLRSATDEIHQNAQTRLQLEGRLRRSEKLATIGQLAAEIAHEVGTPLNVIGGRARNLERKADQPEEVRKNAGIIADQVERITKIIQQLLDLARAPMPKREPVALDRVLSDALAFLQEPIESAGVEVTCEPSDRLPSIEGDADGMQQVVLNLLLNAIQAMSPDGKLQVSVGTSHRRREGLDHAPPQDFVLLTVTDDGPGISPAQAARVFDPFFTTKPRGEGTGLGLTVAQGIVKSHDGWIEIGANQPQGTIVRVFVPVQPDAATEETSA